MGDPMTEDEFDGTAPDQPARPVEERPDLSVGELLARLHDAVVDAKVSVEQVREAADMPVTDDGTPAGLKAVLDDAYRQGVEVGRRSIPEPFPAHWGVEERERHRRHLEVLGRQAKDDAFDRGVRIGRAEGEAAAINQHPVMMSGRAGSPFPRHSSEDKLWQSGYHAARYEALQEAAVVQPFDFATEEVDSTGPTTYGAAVEAMHAAVRLVHPVAVPFDDANIAAIGDRHALMATTIADHLVRWLSEHIEPDTGDVDTCGSCSQPRERHDPDCLYAARTWGTGPGSLKVTMSQGQFTPDPVPDLVDGVTADGSAYDPNLVRNLPPVGSPEDISDRVNEGFRLASEPYEGGLIEDDDGAPLPPEQQPCPECQAGKHANCGGYVLDSNDQHVVCPCPDDTHNGC